MGLENEIGNIKTPELSPWNGISCILPEDGLTNRNILSILLISVQFCGTLPSDPLFNLFYFERVHQVPSPKSISLI